MLLRDQYLKTVRRPYRPLFVSLIEGGFKNYDNFKAFLDTPFAIREMALTDATWFYGKKELERGGKLILEHWLKSPKNFERSKKIMREREEALIDATAKNFPTYTQAFETYSPALIMVWVTDQPVADAISKYLPVDLVNELNTPLEINYHKQEQYDLITTDDIKAHIKNYAWINSRYGEVMPYTVAQALERRSKISKQEFLKEWTQEKERVQKTIERAKKLLPQNKQHLVDIMQFIIYYRTHRTDTINKSIYLHVPQLRKLAKQKGLTYEQLIHCTKDEILGTMPQVKQINARIKDYAIVMEDGRIRCVSGAQADKIRQFFSDETTDTNELKGKVAYPGNVKGAIKIIHGPADYAKFKAGDILVASMTTPNMIPVIKMAAGIVTDEGGITCHAAIISRELKKPCVIGTKHASKILKDGDMVEVDANKGLVRKL